MTVLVVAGAKTQRSDVCPDRSKTYQPAVQQVHNPPIFTLMPEVEPQTGRNGNPQKPLQMLDGRGIGQVLGRVVDLLLLKKFAEGSEGLGGPGWAGV